MLLKHRGKQAVIAFPVVFLHVHAAIADLALPWIDEAANQLSQRGFARAVEPHERNVLARADGERNIEKRVLLRAGIAVGNPFQLDGLRRGVGIAFEAARAAVCFGIE